MHEFDDPPSLEQLVASASEGDGEAILDLYERYNDVVCRIALYYLWLKGCDNAADHSEDIISSAWLAILEHIDQLEHAEKIEAWMNTIILNLVLNHASASGLKGCINNQNHRVSLEAAEAARIAHAEQVCEDLILANEIRKEADARSVKFGRVLRLYIEEERTMDEIAKEFDESPAKLRSMYYRNLSGLQGLFRDKGRDKDDPSKC